MFNRQVAKLKNSNFSALRPNFLTLENSNDSLQSKELIKIAFI